MIRRVMPITGACLLVLATFPGPAAAQPVLPGKSGAPGSQTGSPNPFAGLAEQPEANLFTGAATTTVPFVVPPGRSGMTPNLGLTYTSTGGRGPYGHGWSLATGRVSRALDDGVPRYVDVDPATPEGPKRDTFVLELQGAVIELVPGEREGSYRPRFEGPHMRIELDDRGNYWMVVDKNGTVFYFGRESERFNSRIGAHTQARDGTFAWLLERAVDVFGNQIDYTYEPPDPTAPDGRLARIDYGGSSGDPRRVQTPPRRLPHVFSVRFDWQDNGTPSPPQVSYRAGFRQVVGDRWTLASVTTRAEDETVRRYDLVYDEVRAPGAAPGTTPAVRLLRNVEVEAFDRRGGSVVPPPTTFDYAPALQLGWPIGTEAEREQHALVVPAPNRLHHVGDAVVKYDVFDINGDGLVDYVQPPLVRFGTGQTEGADAGFVEGYSDWQWSGPTIIRKSTSHQNFNVDIFDVTGDGLPDLVDADHLTCATRCLGSSPPEDCWPGRPRPVSCWDVYVNTGKGFSTTPLPWAAPRDIIRDLEGDGQVEQDVVDMNGDGRPDFVVANGTTNPPSAGYWHVYLGHETGFEVVPVEWPAEQEHISLVEEDDSGNTFSTRYGLVDMNGDGLPDMLDARDPDDPDATHTSTWRVFFNDGHGFDPPVAWQIENSTERPTTFYANSDRWSVLHRAWKDLVDVTGDGLPDLVRSANDGPTDSCGQLPTCDDNPGLEPPACCTDAKILINTGASFTEPVSTPTWKAQTTGSSSDWALRIRDYSSSPPDPGKHWSDLFDFDGDGLVDLVEDHGSEWHVYRNPASPLATWTSTPDSRRYKPNLLVSMMNGLGGMTVLEYAPASLLPDAMCSYSGSGEPEEGRCLPFPHWVVTTSTVEDPSSPIPAAETTYAYESPRFDNREREFVGFRTVWATDQLGKSKVHTFHQDPARKGLLEEVAVLGNPDCAPGASCDPWQFVLGVEHNDWNDDPVELDAVTSTPWVLGAGANYPDLAREKVTFYGYDEYGNETLRSVVADGKTTSTHTVYAYRVSSHGERYLVNKPELVWTEDDTGHKLSQKEFKYRGGRGLKRVDTCIELDGDGECGKAMRATFKADRNAGLVIKEKLTTRGKVFTTYDEHMLYASKITDTAGLTTYYEHDVATGYRTRTEGPDGQVTEIDYDGLGRPVEIRGPDPVTGEPFAETSYTYVDPDPEYGQSGHVLQESYGSAPIATFYDGFQRQIAQKTKVDATADGTHTMLSGMRLYDERGQVIREAAPFDVTDIDPEVDELNVTFDELPEEEQTALDYEPHTATLRLRTLPDGSTTEHVRSRPGVEMTVDANLYAALNGGGTGFEGSARIDYLDALGRLVARDECSVRPDVENGAACPDASLLSSSQYDYDGLDRQTRITQIDVDAPGSPAYVLQTIEYNAIGKQARVVDADTGTRSFTYGKNGLLSEATDAMGRVTHYDYDKAGRLATESRDGFKAKYSYHDSGPGAGRLMKVSSSGPDASTTKLFEYDLRGLVGDETWTASIVVDGTRSTSLYTFHNTYDKADRLITTTYPEEGSGGQAVDRLVFTRYSPYGRPIGLSRYTDEIVDDVVYDVYGHVARIDYANGVSDLYEYAPPSGNGYLACSRTTRAPAVGTACQPQANDAYGVAYTVRDAVGRVRTIEDAVRPWPADASAYISADYDPLGRMLLAQYGGSSQYDFFDYDALGNATLINNKEVEYEKTLGHPHRPSVFGNAPVEHDANGNRTVKGAYTYAYDSSDRLTSVAQAGIGELSESFYDEGTNRIGHYDREGDALTHYLAGRLEIDVGAHEVVRYFYLGDRRVASDRVEAAEGLILVGGSTGEVLADGGKRFGRASSASGDRLQDASSLAELRSRLLREDNASAWPPIGRCAALALVLGLLALAAAQPRRRRVPALTAVIYLVSFGSLPYLQLTALGVGATPAHAQVSVGDRIYYHVDHLGSPHTITDGAGNVVELLRYRAFGKLRGVFDAAGTHTQTTSTNVTFAGQEPDEDSELIYFGARFYDPDMGLFLTPDPAGQLASPYSYTGFDPLNGIDPDGRWFQALWAAISPFIPLIFGVAAFVSTVVQTGNVGLAIKAGVFAGLTSYAISGFSEYALVPVIQESGFVDVPTYAFASVAQGGYSAAQSIRKGDILTGVLSALVLAGGLAASAEQAVGQRAGTGDAYGTSDGTAQGGNENSETVTVLIEEPDPASPDKLSRLGLSGHSGAAVGEDYWDYGPQPREGADPLGSRGRPWWDAFANPKGDASLSEIKEYVHARGLNVHAFSAQVTSAQAAGVRQYWQRLYADPGRYQFAIKNCTTTVSDSLRYAGVIRFRAVRPSILAEGLRGLGWKETRF